MLESVFSFSLFFFFQRITRSVIISSLNHTTSRQLEEVGVKAMKLTQSSDIFVHFFLYIYFIICSMYIKLVMDPTSTKFGKHEVQR